MTLKRFKVTTKQAVLVHLLIVFIYPLARPFCPYPGPSSVLNLVVDCNPNRLNRYRNGLNRVVRFEV